MVVGNLPLDFFFNSICQNGYLSGNHSQEVWKKYPGSPVLLSCITITWIHSVVSRDHKSSSGLFNIRTHGMGIRSAPTLGFPFTECCNSIFLCQKCFYPNIRVLISSGNIGYHSPEIPVSSYIDILFWESIYRLSLDGYTFSLFGDHDFCWHRLSCTEVFNEIFEQKIWIWSVISKYSDRRFSDRRQKRWLEDFTPNHAWIIMCDGLTQCCPQTIVMTQWFITIKTVWNKTIYYSVKYCMNYYQRLERKREKIDCQTCRTSKKQHKD